MHSICFYPFEHLFGWLWCYLPVLWSIQHYVKTLEQTIGTIKNRLSRDTGNIEHKKHNSFIRLLFVKWPHYQSAIRSVLSWDFINDKALNSKYKIITKWVPCIEQEMLVLSKHSVFFQVLLRPCCSISLILILCLIMVA